MRISLSMADFDAEVETKRSRLPRSLPALRVWRRTLWLEWRGSICIAIKRFGELTGICLRETVLKVDFIFYREW